MNGCHCGAGPLSSITFDGAVEMLRCKLCGATSWTLEGQPVEHVTAHAALRGTFISQRRQVQTARAPRPPRVLDLREPVAAPAAATVTPSGDVEGALAALLRAKGVTGSWAVSG